MPNDKEIILIACSIAVGGNLLSAVYDANLDTSNIYKVWKGLGKKLAPFMGEICKKKVQAAVCRKEPYRLKWPETIAINMMLNVF